ncbi:putative bifunctional diguanylate cyclase/phosphodiesterase [Aquipuribacter hungaricus]|uniref:Bifunctional diguanylate cyclase/phosphodiesterase n=1 Tax=Aquipuribacter hungaricus TaxID=545624 RepID=A0ABV7WFV7_9MICO
MLEAADDALARSSSVVERMPLGLVQISMDGTLLDANPAFARLVGRSAESMAGSKALDLLAPQDRHLAFVEIASHEMGRTHGVFTCRVRSTLGGERWVRLQWRTVEEDGRPPYVLAFVHDVEVEARAALVGDELLAAVEAERAILNAALEASPDGISIFTADRGPDGEVVDALLVRMNQAGAGSLTLDGLVGRSVRDFFPEADETGFHAVLLEAFRSQQTQRLVVEVSPGSTWEGVYDNVVVPIDADRVLCTFRNITRARHDEMRLLHAATHDALTGLPNRVLLRDRIEHALHRVARDGGAVTIAFLDLDGFKTINDTRGHTYGDEVLRQVSSRLTRSVRDGDTVARLGGDEFVLVLEGCADEQDWLPVHGRVTAALSEPLVVDGHPVTLRASIGVVFTSPGETDADAVMRNADIAMYASKNAGKSRYTVFTEEHRRQVLDLAALEVDLERAVEENQFELYSQPIHDLRLGRVVGNEVLLRWRHPDRGVLLPASFLPALETAGRMVEVGGWVLREALRQTAARRAQGHEDMVTVNVSVQQLVRSDFVRTVREALEESGTVSRCLTVEITESQMLPSRSSVLGQLQELRNLGVRVAVDDFGTGYSSLSHLADLPVDLVKIDRSFLVDLSDARREAVLRSAVELTTAVGAECLVEGVETVGQLELVHATGARFAQGFLLGRPAPFEG